MERILPIEDYRHSADPSQLHPGADHTCQDIKTTGCSLTTNCVLIFAASRQKSCRFAKVSVSKTRL